MKWEGKQTLMGYRSVKDLLLRAELYEKHQHHLCVACCFITLILQVQCISLLNFRKTVQMLYLFKSHVVLQLIDLKKRELNIRQVVCIRRWCIYMRRSCCNVCIEHREESDLMETKWKDRVISCPPHSSQIYIFVIRNVMSKSKLFTLTCLIVVIDFHYGWLQLSHWDILQNPEGQAECLICHLESKRELQAFFSLHWASLIIHLLLEGTTF